MGTTFEFPDVTKEDGTVVSHDELQRATSEPDAYLPFIVNGLKFTMAVKRSKIPASPVLAYRSKLAELQKESGALDDYDETTIERINAIRKKVQGKSEEVIKEITTPEERTLLRSFIDKYTQIEAQGAPKLFPLQIDIVAKGILGWNWPAPHNAETLKGDSTLADSVVNAFWAWYDPTSADSEAETEPIPTANTAKSPSASPQKGNSETSPADS